ncbi:MAG: hypothetical protein IT384_28160 [Deltaproteobacteria bacterium]|nr:hypothetical protein [Deltaproteobacteria bacterium]
MKPAASYVLAALPTFVASCTGSTSHPMEKSDMSDHDLEIRRRAAAEHQWRESDLEVARVRGLELPPCQFYSVSQRALPVHEAAIYALLPGGAIVSQSDPSAVDKILAACDAAAASAGTWAELLARFHWDVGPGAVMYQSEPPLGAGDAPQPIVPPAIRGGKLRFFLKNHETQKRYEVSAVLGERSVSQISKRSAE